MLLLIMIVVPLVLIARADARRVRAWQRMPTKFIDGYPK